MTGAECDLRKEQQRERREESREKREEVPRKAARGPQMKPQEVPNEVLEASGPRRHGAEKGRSLRGKREERREKRENCRKLDSLHFYRVAWPPRKIFENPRGPPKWQPARFTAFL